MVGSSISFTGAGGVAGNVVTFPVVLGKICIDQFGYNPFFAAPFGVITYEWKNSGFSLESLVRAFTWDHYRDKVVPTLLATWSVWIPLMAIIYSLPLALQFPLFSLALTFWVLLLTYMTNSFPRAHSVTRRRRDRFSSPSIPISMKSHEIFQHMTPALSPEILTYLQQERTTDYKRIVQGLAQQRKLRPVFVERKPLAERYPWLTSRARSQGQRHLRGPRSASLAPRRQ